MKAFRKIIIPFLLMLVLLSGCSKNTESETATPAERYVKIKDNIYFENRFDDYQAIFYLTEQDSIDDDDKIFIEHGSYIIKYSFDGNDNIAFHSSVLKNDYSEGDNVPYRTRGFGEGYYRIESDYFVVYNISNSDYKKFESQHEFVEYCKENNLNLFDFKYSNGLGVMEYEEKAISERVKLISFGNPFPKKLLIDNEIVFEGYISDCTVEKDILKFNIKIPDKAYFELPNTSNSGIPVSKEPVSEYKWGLFLKENIFFDGEVKYDIGLKKVVD